MPEPAPDRGAGQGGAGRAARGHRTGRAGRGGRGRGRRGAVRDGPRAGPAERLVGLRRGRRPPVPDRDGRRGGRAAPAGRRAGRHDRHEEHAVRLRPVEGLPGRRAGPRPDLPARRPTWAPGRASTTSRPRRASAQPPPVVGSRSTAIWGSPASRVSTDWRATRWSWVSARMPSCIRLPPVAISGTTGSRCSRAYVYAACQPVPGALAQRTAEEAELEGDQHRPGALHLGGAAHHRLRLAGALGGAGAGSVVTVPAEGTVGGVLPYGAGQFLEVVGDEGDRRAGARTALSHGPAPAS
ncbi:hypothetical protein SGLAM104S_03190 [Streptomyces glaucescens]